MCLSPPPLCFLPQSPVKEREEERKKSGWLFAAELRPHEFLPKGKKMIPHQGFNGTNQCIRQFPWCRHCGGPMAVGGGSLRFSVQLNLNWFVFNTGDFFLSFEEVALQKDSRLAGAGRTLRRDDEAASTTHLCTILLRFRSGLVGPGEAEENLNTCH